VAAGSPTIGGRAGRRPAVRGLALVLLVAAVVLLAGCRSVAEPSAAAASPPSGTSPPAIGASGPPASSRSSASSLPPASSPETVVADAALLAVLPSAVDGFVLVPVPEAVPEAAADPAVAAVVDRMAFAVAVDPVGGDQVVALVAHLRSGRLDAAGYRAWRDSFDRGVCERAGGVSGHAELTLGGRQVAVGICAEGVRTYHVLLSGRGLVVSAQSIGARRLGERLMATLEE
jgi:hypothetical protein